MVEEFASTWLKRFATGEADLLGVLGGVAGPLVVAALIDPAASPTDVLASWLAFLGVPSGWIEDYLTWLTDPTRADFLHAALLGTLTLVSGSYVYRAGRSARTDDAYDRRLRDLHKRKREALPKVPPGLRPGKDPQDAQAAAQRAEQIEAEELAAYRQKRDYEIWRGNTLRRHASLVLIVLIPLLDLSEQTPATTRVAVFVLALVVGLLAGIAYYAFDRSSWYPLEPSDLVWFLPLQIVVALVAAATAAAYALIMAWKWLTVAPSLKR